MKAGGLLPSRLLAASVPFMRIDGEIEDSALVVLAENLHVEKVSRLLAAERTGKMMTVLDVVHERLL
jgi:hypothetical protein